MIRSIHHPGRDVPRDALELISLYSSHPIACRQDGANSILEKQAYGCLECTGAPDLYLEQAVSNNWLQEINAQLIAQQLGGC